MSIIKEAESAPALDVPRRRLLGAVEDLGKLDYDNLPEAASRYKPLTVSEKRACSKERESDIGLFQGLQPQSRAYLHCRAAT